MAANNRTYSPRVPRARYPTAFDPTRLQSKLIAADMPIRQAQVFSEELRHVMQKQAVDEEENYRWIEKNLGGGVPPIFVAASNASSKSKSLADVVCPGSFDGDNAAISTLWDGSGDGYGRFILSEGTFYIRGRFAGGMPGGFTDIRGMGLGATYVLAEDGDTTFFLGNYSEASIADLSIYSQDGVGTGISLGGNGAVTNCLVQGFVVGINAGDGSPSQHVGIINNVVAECSGRGINLGHRNRVIGNRLFDCGHAIEGGGFRSTVIGNVIEQAIKGITTDFDASLQCVFANNIILDVQEEGIRARFLSDSIIEGNVILNAGLATNNTWPAILVTDDRNLIAMNHIRWDGAGNQISYGIELTANADDNKVFGNDAFGAWATAAVLDNGTGTDLTAANR